MAARDVAGWDGGCRTIPAQAASLMPRADVPLESVVFPLSMEGYRRTVLAWLGTLLVVAGFVGGFLLILGPWRSCPEIDSSSASCGASETEQGLLGAVLLALALGVILLVNVFASQRRKIQADEASPFGKFD